MRLTCEIYVYILMMLLRGIGGDTPIHFASFQIRKKWKSRGVGHSPIRGEASPHLWKNNILPVIYALFIVKIHYHFQRLPSNLGGGDYHPLKKINNVPDIWYLTFKKKSENIKVAEKATNTNPIDINMAKVIAFILIFNKWDISP